LSRSFFIVVLFSALYTQQREKYYPKDEVIFAGSGYS